MKKDDIQKSISIFESILNKQVTESSLDSLYDELEDLERMEKNETDKEKLAIIDKEIRVIQDKISQMKESVSINEFNSKYDMEIKDLEADLKSGELSDSEAKQVRNKLNMLKSQAKMSNRPGGKEIEEDYNVKPEVEIPANTVAATGIRPPGAGNSKNTIVGEEPVQEADFDFRGEPDANDQWEAVMDKLNQGVRLIEVGNSLRNASAEFKDKIEDDLEDVIRTLTEIKLLFRSNED